MGISSSLIYSQWTNIYEEFNEYSSGIQELVEVKPITENDQDIREIRNGLLTLLNPVSYTHLDVYKRQS